MVNDTNLERCPFCGALADMTHFNTPFGERYSVSCTNYDCPVMPVTRTFNSAEKAAEAWNRRAE